MQSRRSKLGLCFLFFGLVLGLVVATVLGAFFWYKINLSPTPNIGEKIVVIAKGDSISQISDKLEKEGVIRSSLAFRIYLKISKGTPNIQAGSFKIKTGLTSDQVLQQLSVGRVDKWLTIREGLRNEEIADLLAAEFPVKASEFLKIAREGYMFPDTYLLPLDANAQKAASILAENFDKKVDASLKQSITSSGRNLDEILILASLVERESRSGDERPIIAGILIKRWQQGMLLEVDASIQYALGYQQSEKTWWKKNLTEDDLKIDSPFNTRKNIGLPPAPICNPGLEAIKAVANPESSSYYYYLHDKSGQVHFAKTLDEHNANVAKYLQ